MRPLFFLILFAAAVYLIPASPKGQFFGEPFDTSNPKPISEVLKTEIDSVGMFAIVSGTIEAVCQEKGCWLTLKTDSTTIRVRFKNYGFFVPKDIAGREVVLAGIIRQEKTSAAVEQHYREDAGDTTKVVMPEYIIKTSFLASGVYLKSTTGEKCSMKDCKMENCKDESHKMSKTDGGCCSKKTGKLS